MKAIVCNHTGNHYIRAGAKAYVKFTNPGNATDRICVYVRTRSGRYVAKWESLKRLYNFRVACLPPHMEDKNVYKEEISKYIHSETEELIKRKQEWGQK